MYLITIIILDRPTASRSKNSKLFAALLYREVHKCLPDLYEALQVALYKNPTRPWVDALGGTTLQSRQLAREINHPSHTSSRPDQPKKNLRGMLAATAQSTIKKYTNLKW